MVHYLIIKTILNYETTDHRPQTTDHRPQTLINPFNKVFLLLLFSFSLFVTSCTEIESPREEISLRAVPDNNSASTLGCNFDPAVLGCVKKQGELENVLFAACTYKINFTYFICPTGIIIKDMVYLPEENSNGACEAFNSKITNLISNNQTAEARQILDGRHAFFANAVQNFILNFNVDKIDFLCGPSASFNSTFIAADCIELCHSDGKIVELICGNTCCIRQQQFCFDPNELTLTLIGDPSIEKGNDDQCNYYISECSNLAVSCDGSDCRRLGSYNVIGGGI